MLRGPQSPARVLEALWPDKTDQRTAITATSRIRSAIAPATITLTDDRYGLDGVDSDWTRFGRMVTEAKTLDSSGAMVLLEGALSMVMCRPFEGRQVFDGRSSTWEWLDHGYVEADVLVRIVDAAEALAELALHAGDASKVLWACEKARLVEPHRVISGGQAWRDIEGRRDFNPAHERLLKFLLLGTVWGRCERAEGYVRKRSFR